MGHVSLAAATTRSQATTTVALCPLVEIAPPIVTAYVNEGINSL
jgi:hypothetical protein